MGDVPFIGEIRLFAGNFAPNGWLWCQGQTLQISDYDTLFNLIGTTYGGDGQNTFHLPDLRGRVPVHRSPSYPVGASFGAETVSLDNHQVPPHTHPLWASSKPASTTSPAGVVPAVSADGAHWAPAGSATPVAMTSTSGAGGGAPHDNMQPFLGLGFIISPYGIYPTQS